MRIIVVAKAGAKTQKILKVSDDKFRVFVKAPPVEGKANEAIVKLLSEYFDVPKSSIDLTKGHKSSVKIFEIK